MPTASRKHSSPESFIARLMRDFGTKSERWLREHLGQPHIGGWVAANSARFRPVERGTRRGYQLTISVAECKGLPGAVRGSVTFGMLASAKALQCLDHRHLLKCAIAMGA
jgi:hypothetical protein